MVVLLLKGFNSLGELLLLGNDRTHRFGQIEDSGV